MPHRPDGLRAPNSLRPVGATCWGVEVTVLERSVLQPGRAAGARAALARPDALEHVLVAVAATVWLLVLTPRSGGFHEPSTAVAAVGTLPALVVTKPWLQVSRSLLLLTGAAAAGAALSLTTSRAGWQQADSPAAQLLGLLALVLTVAYARTPARRTAVAVVLLTAIGLQFVPAVKAWQGSGDPDHVMVGTFYWHNQLGIWMAGLGLLATALGVAGTGRLRVAALCLAPFADACVLLSTSRTSLGLLIVGQLALLAVIPGCTARRWALCRWALVPVTTVALFLVLTSSLFFDHAGSGLSAFQGSAAAGSVAGNRGTESLASNGGDRGRWTGAALAGWLEAPVTGHGFGSFRYTEGDHLPATSLQSAFVHDGYAEALTSGGIVFGLPLLAVSLLLAAATIRGFLHALRRETPGRALLAGAAVTTGALLVHTGLDFDWHYPSLVVLIGVVGGLLIRPTGRPAPAPPVIAGLFAVVAVIVTGSLVEHHGRQAIAAGGSAQQLLDVRLPFADDPRLDAAALRACVHDGRLVVPGATARRAIAASARAASLDKELALLRSVVGQLVDG